MNHDLAGYSNNNDVLPIYIGDDRTDEDAFKVNTNLTTEQFSNLIYRINNVIFFYISY